MTLIAALSAIKGKLVFGDPLQIAAVRLIEAVEGCAAAIEACPHDAQPCERCKGSGSVSCECIECGDTHERDCPDCDGDETGGPCAECTKPYPSAIISAAVEWREREKRKAQAA